MEKFVNQPILSASGHIDEDAFERDSNTQDIDAMMNEHDAPRMQSPLRTTPSLELIAMNETIGGPVPCESPRVASDVNLITEPDLKAAQE